MEKETLGNNALNGQLSMTSDRSQIHNISRKRRPKWHHPEAAVRDQQPEQQRAVRAFDEAVRKLAAKRLQAL